MPAKSAWRSKTYLSNVFVASAVELWPRVGAWIAAHPQTAVLLVTAMNLGLRHFSKAPIQYRRKA